MKSEYGKTKVMVKYGKPVIYSNIPRKTAERLAANDAIERLVKAYPHVEDIETSIAVNEEYSRVLASASGFIRKSNKADRFINKITIKDIFNTTLYRDIKKAIGDRFVKKYSITCYRKFDKEIGITFKGRDSINWKAIERYINSYNLDTFNRIRNGEKITKFYIDLNKFGSNDYATDNSWEGIIMLNDGSWITIEKQYDDWENEWYDGVVLHNFPEEIKCDELFSVNLTIKKENSEAETKSFSTVFAGYGYTGPIEGMKYKYGLMGAFSKQEAERDAIYLFKKKYPEIKDIEVIAINKLPEVGERFYFAIASSKFKQ